MAILSRSALALGFFLFVACTGGSGGTGIEPAPVENGVITSASGVEVKATISSVTLGDECGGSAGKTSEVAAGDCAPDELPDGGRRSGNCGGGRNVGCQQSNVQISFSAGPGSTSARIEIVRVTLHDDAGGAELDTLTASAPQAWIGSSYGAWNQQIAPSTNVQASYNLSAPKWSTMGAGATASSYYSKKFRLRVALRVDGAPLTLESVVVNREPNVAT